MQQSRAMRVLRHYSAGEPTPFIITNTAGTFDPTVTTSGGTVTWRNGLTGETFTTNSLSVAGTGVSTPWYIDPISIVRTLDCQNDDVTYVNFKGLPLVTSINCNFNSITGTPDFSGNPLVTSIGMFANNFSGELDLRANPALVQAAFGATSISGVANLSGNPLLTRIELYNTNVASVVFGANTVLTYLLLHRYGQNILMTQSAVDNVIIAIEAFGTSNGTLNVGGSNADPSAGVIATQVAALVSRGWTVTY